MKKIILLSVLFCLTQACSSSTSFTSIPENATIQIANTQISGVTPLDTKIGNTTFGRYMLKVEKEGSNTMYGVLPLRVSSGNIVIAALFFAPALFYNVKTVFESYEFNLEKETIRFKNANKEEWKEYIIPEGEKNEAKHFFENYLKKNGL